MYRRQSFNRCLMIKSSANRILQFNQIKWDGDKRQICMQVGERAEERGSSSYAACWPAVYINLYEQSVTWAVCSPPVLKDSPEDLSSDPARQLDAEEEGAKHTDCKRRESERGRWEAEPSARKSLSQSCSPVSLIHKGYDGWPGRGPGTPFWQELGKREGWGLICKTCPCCVVYCVSMRRI